MRSLFAFFLVFFLCRAQAATNLILWDSAIVRNSDRPGSSKSIELLYSTQPLSVGQVVTTFVPLGKSYRVMCCIKVESGKSLTLSELAETYKYDRDFVKRVRSLKGLNYAYQADFLPTGQLNKNMKAMADSAGDTYYSAVGLPGQSNIERIKGQQFDWPEYGQVSIETIDIGKGFFRHQLKTQSGVVSIEEPSLPD